MTEPKPIIQDKNGCVRETVGTWEIRCYGKGDTSVTFVSKEKDGVDGNVGLEGVTFEVQESERGRGWDGDSARDRIVPFDVILRAAAIFAWAQDYTPVTEVRNGVKVVIARDSYGDRIVSADCRCQGRNKARWYDHNDTSATATCPNITERRPVAVEES
ncbi:hypothetical protein UFOVP1382_101 [uncultured Caudovirales phage]|uniref:Uncharacterized protein n=1 Tax=uncultured Caudovirales phage TaxID=2100421 RepID=A0A6J5S594_9CAUD|nr:hypothetical protein UFOVP1382_101 [uncultured Caudovirales phage]